MRMNLCFQFKCAIGCTTIFFRKNRRVNRTENDKRQAWFNDFFSASQILKKVHYYLHKFVRYYANSIRTLFNFILIHILYNNNNIIIIHITIALIYYIVNRKRMCQNRNVRPENVCDIIIIIIMILIFRSEIE